MQPLPRNAVRFILTLFLLSASPFARADAERAFSEGRSGKGELKYINSLPVLVVAGTPEEMGLQRAVLTSAAITKLVDYPRLLLERSVNKDVLPKYLETSKALVQRLPADYRAELRAFADRSGIDRNMGMLGNTLADLHRGGVMCSSMVISPEKSATGGPLFGRNLDFPTLGLLDKYSLVTVYRPSGKHSFVSVGFPGLFGCLTGMNDAGLTLAVHEVYISRDGAEIFNDKGMPYSFLFRKILEECRTVEDAEKLVRDSERTTILSLSVCDRHRGLVLEMTPRTVATRGETDGVLACTNHFRTDELAFFKWCPRYRRLVLARGADKIDVADLGRRLDEVNLGRLTVQTMVFEPAALKLHLAIGSCPSSALPLKTLDLKPLM